MVITWISMNCNEALHSVTGDEEEYLAYYGARIRVLAVCYDIRHALMGDREIEFVDNGLDEEKMRRMSVILRTKHLSENICIMAGDPSFGFH